MLALLDRRRTLPAGTLVESRTMRDGWTVRTASRPGDDPARGSILFLNGRGDFIEKYAEVLHDWTARGFGFATFDWRGQGGSGRFLADRQKGHAPSFAPWRADLAEQVAWFNKTLPSPHFAVAHSMGGHLLLRHLTTTPTDFARAILLSPMCGLRAEPVGASAAKLIAKLACALGFAESYAPGSGAIARGLPGTIRQRRLTHDLVRYADEGWWLETHSELGIGGVTNGWLNSAFASLDDLLTPGVVEAITTPLLILTASEEALVDNAVTALVAARLREARLREIIGSGHELVREIDTIRLPVFAAIAEWLQ